VVGLHLQKNMVNQKYQHLYPALQHNYKNYYDYASFDVETTGLRPYNGAKMFSYCIGWPQYKAGVLADVTVDVTRLDGMYREQRRGWSKLRSFFADSTIAKVAHNFKFELSFLKIHKITVPTETIWFDTMLASQLLRNLAPSHKLDYLAWEIFGYSNNTDKEVQKAAKAVGHRYDLVDKDLMDVYQYHDGVRPCLLWDLWHVGERDLHPETTPALWGDYLNEIALCVTTERMERYGMMIDTDEIEELLIWLRDEFNKVQQETFQYLGEYINLNSDAKLRTLLFDRMGFPVLRTTKKGVPVTDKFVLGDLKEQHPKEKIFDLILRWRSYSNGISMNEKYLQLMDDYCIIHPNIKTNHARTGRESSEAPNMQNISKEAAFDNPYPVPSRKAFRARPKHIMFLIDYSGIEMRLIADRSGEQTMIDAFTNGGDPHHLATEIFGSGFGDVNKMKISDKTKYKILRGGVKNIHFALAYGAGIFKLTNMINSSPAFSLDVDEMKILYDLYAERFPNVATFASNTSKLVHELGYITTPFGRGLWVAQDKAYTAANYLIQGTAAGILKRAQVRVDDYFKTQWSDDIKIVLPIHDEIVIEMPMCYIKYRDYILYNVAQRMTTMDEIVVPLEVEAKKARTTWARAKEYTFRKAA
jgi:DNA polymerase-1